MAPVTVTGVPPAAGPELGLTEVTCGLGPRVGVNVGVRVPVAVDVRVGVNVRVGVGVGVAVAMGVFDAVNVRVGVNVWLGVNVRVGVNVTVGVCVGVDVKAVTLVVAVAQLLEGVESKLAGDESLAITLAMTFKVPADWGVTWIVTGLLDQEQVTVIDGSLGVGVTGFEAHPGEPAALKTTLGLKTAVIQTFDAVPPAWVT